MAILIGYKSAMNWVRIGYELATNGRRTGDESAQVHTNLGPGVAICLASANTDVTTRNYAGICALCGRAQFRAWLTFVAVALALAATVRSRRAARKLAARRAHGGARVDGV